MRALVFLVCLIFSTASIAQYQPRPKPPVSGAPSYSMPAGQIYENLDTLPQARFGYDAMRIRTTTDQPSFLAGPINTGAFRVNCSLSHMSFDDPIVYPGMSGRNHLHAFAGNTLTGGGSDPTKMATAGRSTCNGGLANRSAYWAPPLIDDRDGTVMVPGTMNFYYKCADSFSCNNIQWAPPNLRMIIGKATNADPSQLPGRVECYLNGSLCNGGVLPGYVFDHIPTEAEAIAIGGCDEINYFIEFYNCWDGVNLDSPDHISHMKRSTFGVGCPATHPVLIPHITLNIHTKITQSNLAHYRLASDQPRATATGPCATAAKNYCAGASLHSDWWNGWSTAVVPALGMSVTDAILKECLSKNKVPTGNRDCHDNLLGAPNGDSIYYTLY
jgi:hypothetical protein